jgi:hypothetical protein
VEAPHPSLSASRAWRPSLLKDQHEDSKHSGEAERVHRYLFEPKDKRAGHREEHGNRHHDDDYERDRQMVLETVL